MRACVCACARASSSSSKIGSHKPVSALRGSESSSCSPIIDFLMSLSLFQDFICAMIFVEIFHCYIIFSSFPGVKRPGRAADHPLPSSAEVKERV